MAATIDHVSNGRLEFGIGAAWHAGEHEMYGIPFPGPKEREDRLEEAVRVIRMLFDSDAPVDFDGRYYHLRNAVFLPKGVQRRHPPIMIGGGGEKRTLRTLAMYGDVMNVSGTPEIVQRKIEVLQRHCGDVGRDPGEIEITTFGTIVVSDNEKLIDRVAAMFGGGLGLSVEQAKEQLPIGSGEHVRSVVQRYADVGVTQMIMASQGPWKREVYERINAEVVEPCSV
jgi:alkanesulfonate monooxygenase SsuD/methylene tetrahydromethanopterin reductase-like flavin-dependent oxidoreductase (luciferase family)